ncbi:MAG: triphosphoribosyl-dephospho-CoA synthase [Candidatus Bathyarchaeia archaeon]|jgi:triphosphoribosyl-dephospho-CoA synthase
MESSLWKSRHIANCLELAILLESGAHKPGNVSVVTNFEGTRYEHFLASAVAVAPSLEYAAMRGIAVSKGEIHVGDVGVGRIIEDCVENINAWQHGGNTLLGTVIMLSPLAVAAGMSRSEKGIFNAAELRKNLRLIVESTTPEDAVKLYEAIRNANPSGLGKVSDLDVNSPDSMSKILNEKISLYQIFKIASRYDTICSEWANDYTITFDFSYPYLTEQIKKTDDPSVAIIQTFLKVLAEYPDTFIARKTGFEKAKEVSAKAAQILRLGALETSIGHESLCKFDQELRQESNLLNPGTTADIISAALALCVLSGYRP